MTTNNRINKDKQTWLIIIDQIVVIIVNVAT